MSSLLLHEDHHFHFEALRSLGNTRYYGSDVQETLQILPKIKPGDFDGWYNEWSNLAKRVLATIDEDNLDKYQPTTVRNVYLRASHYYYVADFFLHLNWDDPRSQEAYTLWRKYYDIANAHMKIPGEHVKLQSEIGEIPIMIYRAEEASAKTPKPTVILGGGFDSNMEELMHAFGFDALERGYNVVIYDGPGQPSFLHEQKVGFIYNWEKAVTPIVDYIFEHSKEELAFIDTSKLGLVGLSLGGYLSARAAAFEPRLAAVMCIDGVFDFLECCIKAIPELEEPWKAQDEAKFNKIFDQNGLKTAPTNRRWIHDHVKYSFQEESGFKLFQTIEKMSLKDGVAEKIKMPAFIGDAEQDIFFLGQPPTVARTIGDNATLHKFTEENGAAAHCAVGAFAYQNQVIWEWFANVIGK
jgi:pimeloyl-ACP methyl ester carboxylesterase